MSTWLILDEPLGYLLHRVAAASRAEVAATVLESFELAAPDSRAAGPRSGDAARHGVIREVVARHVDAQGV
jgi:hypothetical protein